MEPPPDEELARQLIETGNKLLMPPSCIDELLNLLDSLERILSMVTQEPSQLLQDALLPSMKALINNELLRHPIADVKASVASCISEVTRITAPDAPYGDEQMKEIFQLTVALFGKLSNVSGHSYTKAITILDTVAKVRSCLVMLDLECDSMVIEMFQHFLKSIRSNHPRAVFENMEAIMTLTIEESEDISWELLTILMDSVKKGNQGVSPMSCKLGETVIKNCAAKLKPHILKRVQSMGIGLNDFTQTISSICQTSSDNLEQNHFNTSKFDQGSSELVPNAIDCGKAGAGFTGSKSLLISDTAQARNYGTSADKNHRKNLAHCCQTKESEGTDERGNDEPNNLKNLKPVTSEIESGSVTKKRGRRPNSLMNPEEGYDHSWVSGGRKDRRVPHRGKNHGSAKVIDDMPSENPVSKEAGMPLRHAKNVESQDFSREVSQSEVTGSIPTSNRSFPAGIKPKKGRRRKENMTQKDGQRNSQSVPKGRLISIPIKDGDPKLADIIVKKEVKETSDLATDTRGHSRKKAVERRTPGSRDAISREEGHRDYEDGQNMGTKKRRGQPKQVVIEVSGEKNIVGSAVKSSNESNLGVTPMKTLKRKRFPGMVEDSGTPHGVKDLGEELIGSRIKVWWPQDKMFYEGFVDSFDRNKKKHKVLYVDGDEEILNLGKQRWERISDGILPDKKNEKVVSIQEASFDIRQKTLKIKLESPAKSLNSENSTKKHKSASSSKRVKASTVKSEDDCTQDGPTVLDKPRVKKFQRAGKMKNDGQTPKRELKIQSQRTREDSEPKVSENEGLERISNLAHTEASSGKSGKKRNREILVGYL